MCDTIANYLLSVSCMMVKPSKHPEFPLAKTRWEDMIMIHKSMTPKVHFVGQFLPWHRMFLHHFETVLRNECLYQGALPYWDMSIDVAGGWANSPVLDKFLGFGGDGVEIGGQPGAPGTTGGGCISSGLFKNLKTNIPYLDSLTPLAEPRCVIRARDMMAINTWMGANRVKDVLTKTTFEEFSLALEGDVNFADLYAKLGVSDSI